MSASFLSGSPVGPTIAPLSKSTLSQQFERRDGERTPTSIRTRSASEAPKPTLSPSPAIREPSRPISKDDSAVINPVTPRRTSHHPRGLSLQLPLKESLEDATTSPVQRVPLSPKLDASQIYGSPAPVLPRRSRGLDFARACTNLHHSTLAESSPDASPINGRAIQIPQRRSLAGSNTVLDSPSNVSQSMWTTTPGERPALSSSVSSINMIDSDTGSDSSDDDMAVDRETDDPLLNTPAVSRLSAQFLSQSPGMDWLNNQPSPAQASLLGFQPNSFANFQRMRLRKGKSSHSSSSVSMRSSKPSPAPLSPPSMKSGENAGYFTPGLTKRQVQSRRESLSLGTDDLHLSDSDEGDPKMISSGGDAAGERGVVRRAVTRRSNMLPKSKGFARIRAALMEESDPLHTDARREAEVIKQVQESDPGFPAGMLDSGNSLTAEPVQDSIEEPNIGQESTINKRTRSNESFSRHAERNSTGPGFWHNFNERYRTPPPSFTRRDSISGLSDEAMDTPNSSVAASSENPALRHLQRSRSRSTTPLASNNAPTAGDVARKVNNKRRRDDDFDPASFKRRAVSPGLSAQSSPVIPQSPVMNNDKSWGRPPAKTNCDRSNSGGSNGNGMKRVGMHGMTEASDGFMSMSID